MKKLGTLALTLTLTGAMALPALAAEEPELVIAPADTGYGQTIVLNGETLDLTGIPGVSGEELLPLRLLAEADHGSAYWDEENNESWFTFGDNRITVKFADNSVWLDDQQVKSTAQVADGITFVEAGVLSMLEGYTVDRNPPQQRPHGEDRLSDPRGERHGLRHAERQRRGGDPLPATRGHL